MTIGFSPFLTADVDEVSSIAAQWGQTQGRAGEDSPVLTPRLELIRRRVVQGYYSSAFMAEETARRILDRDSFDEG
jgi:hypothetical protein